MYENPLNFLNHLLAVEIVVTTRATIAEQIMPIFLRWGFIILRPDVTVIGTYCTRIAHYGHTFDLVRRLNKFGATLQLRLVRRYISAG